MRNKIGSLIVLFTLVVIGVAANHIPVKAPRNLKVLPNTISDQRLDSIMQTYNKALGVGCDFCHVKSKMFNLKDGLDYAADGEPMKENARDMMRMTIDINKNHFYNNKSKEPYLLNTITCNTCHRGETFPTDH
jgi:hypothetical protein